MVGWRSEILMPVTPGIRSTICAVGVLSAISVAAQPRPEPSGGRMLVIRGATVIDGTGAQPRAESRSAHRRGPHLRHRPRADGAARHDRDRRARCLGGAGLIDVHVHLDTPMVFQVSDEERAKILDHNPRAFLYNGVTTVLNVSSDGGVDLRPQGEAARRACAGAAHLRDGSLDHP